jgi:glycosyltransferase involved in cell wall biosynthesis
MKVLWLHNHYKVWGGESAAAEREAALLRGAGATVHQEAADNAAIDQMGMFERAALPLRNAWSRSSYHRVRHLCRELRPDVMHAHNVWPLLSPSVFAAARAEGVPTVFTAHNFYLSCLNGVLFRGGRICTDCVGRLPWAGVAHGCYRGMVGSATRLLGTAVHRALGVFRRVNRILTPTHFAREHFLQTGFAPEQVQAKWLSCEDPWADGRPADDRRPEPAEFLIACRLVPEKGVHIALEAAARAQQPWRLRIAGDGPERASLRQRIQTLGLGDRVELLGHVAPAQLRERMRAATAVLLPSIWYETFGLTAIEAFAAGRPVVASALGAMQEVVDENSGLRVPPGDATAWAQALDTLAATPALAARLGQGARQRYERHFTPAVDAERLLAIYRSITVAGSRPTSNSASPS